MDKFLDLFFSWIDEVVAGMFPAAFIETPRVRRKKDVDPDVRGQGFFEKEIW